MSRPAAFRAPFPYRHRTVEQMDGLWRWLLGATNAESLITAAQREGYAEDEIDELLREWRLRRLPPPPPRY